MNWNNNVIARDELLTTGYSVCQPLSLSLSLSLYESVRLGPTVLLACKSVCTTRCGGEGSTRPTHPISPTCLQLERLSYSLQFMFLFYFILFILFFFFSLSLLVGCLVQIRSTRARF
ncbi:hypothetical protein BDV36DRAFT_88740 [Aspergillus pseudocaelatus]|uniref:Uncharacterized protein n=1 Tax=Aspergillus pseudocaelatus TaxID=1825620 RepID=A0ABQ6W2F7_9EURO|nr:hypothetical protein BDV36DRAFT_88740 [Aspergillus pseudocaelatus]